MRATAFDSDTPLGARRAIIRRAGDEIEMVELRWGLPPGEAGRPFRFVRAEDRRFPAHRCLIAASEFHVRVDGVRYRVTLEDGNWFYLAGIYRPSCGDWPESYAVLTIDANPDVARYQPRQGVVLLKRQAMAWLDLTTVEATLLRPLPARSFIVEPLGGGGWTARQGQLAL